MSDRVINYNISAVNNTDQAFDKVKKNAGNTKGYIDKLGTSIVTKFLGAEFALQTATKAFKALSDGVKEASKAANDKSFDNLNKVFKTLQLQVGTQLLPTFQKLSTLITDNSDLIYKFVGGTVNLFINLSKLVVASFQEIFYALELAFNGVMSLIFTGYSKVVDLVSTGLDKIPGVPDSVIDSLKETAKYGKIVSDEFKEAASKSFENLSKSADKYEESLIGIKNAFKDIPVVTLAENTKKVKEEIIDLGKELKDIYSASTAFSTATDSIFNKVKAARAYEINQNLAQLEGINNLEAKRLELVKKISEQDSTGNVTKDYNTQVSLLQTINRELDNLRKNSASTQRMISVGKNQLLENIGLEAMGKSGGTNIDQKFTASIESMYQSLSGISLGDTLAQLESAQGYSALGRVLDSTKHFYITYTKDIIKDIQEEFSGKDARALKDLEPLGQLLLWRLLDFGQGTSASLGSFKKQLNDLTSDLNNLIIGRDELAKSGTKADIELNATAISSIEKEIALKKQLIIIGTNLTKSNGESQKLLQDGIDKLSTSLIENTAKKLSVSFEMIHSNFANLKSVLESSSDGMTGFQEGMLGSLDAINSSLGAVVDNIGNAKEAIFAGLQSAASGFSQVIANSNNRAIESVNKWYTEEKDKLDKSRMGQRRRAKEEAKLLEEKEKREEDARKQAFQRNKASAIVSTILNTAAAVVKTFSTLGFPAGIPAAIAMGLIGATQVGVIAAQQFANGGIVKGPESGDNVNVRANGGEMVLTRQQQANLFNMAKSGQGGGSSVALTMGDININGTVNQGTLREIQTMQIKQKEDLVVLLDQLGYEGRIQKVVR